MKRSVALLIETSNEYARGILRGVLRYQQEHEHWTIDLPEQHRGADPPRWLRTYGGHGIIARIETDSIARTVRAARLPTVDVSAARQLPAVPWIETDDAAIAKLAVEHFLEKGFRHLAFCGDVAFNWAKWRRDAFVAEAGRYILTHACDGIQVADVVKQTNLTRRALETRFKRADGKTPHELITATRLAKAERLLRETNLTQDRIANRCGLEYAEYLSVLFRKHRDMTPGEYRQQHRQK